VPFESACELFDPQADARASMRERLLALARIALT
jgi:hypothetical protein